MKSNGKEHLLSPGVQCFLALLAEGIHVSFHEAAPEMLQSLSEDDYAQLLGLCRIHNLPLVSERLCRAGLPGSDRIKRELMQIMGCQANATQCLLQLLRELRREEVPALVVKGVVCRQLYPVPELRPSTDEDVYVLPEYTKRAEEVLTRLGFIRTDGDKPSDPVHTWCAGTLRVELHSSLLEGGSLPHGAAKELLSQSFDRKTQIVADGELVDTLCHEEHFLYLILHYYKHFLAGGIGIRQICDICLYAQRYGQEINWNKLWDGLDAMHLKVLVWNLRDIGIRYLAMKEDFMPGGPEELEPDSLELLLDTLEAGVFGSSTLERKHSSTMTIRAAEKGSKRSAGIFSALFPPAEALQGRYPYLEKKPWLLPVAWCSRAFGYMAEGKAVGRRAAQSMDLGEKRLRMLEKYGIIDK